MACAFFSLPSLHYFTLRKIGPEIRAHNLSCQLQFFGAFTKGESRILFRSIVGQQRIGIFAVLLFLYVGFSNSFVLQFCSCIQQWIITLQSPIVSIKRIIFAAERKTVGNEILTTRQKGSSKLLWDSFFPSLVYTFAECRPP